MDDSVVIVDAGAGEDTEFGFSRPDFGKQNLVGTVSGFDRHLFLCWNSPVDWPQDVQGSGSPADALPSLLGAAISRRRDDFKKRTRLTICGGTESSNGNILIFPDMIRYIGLTNSEIDKFVEDILVGDDAVVSGSSEVLKGSYVFICAHGSRDKRCGVCGLALIAKFEEEINSYNLQGQVFVSPCSHIGGHKYAGNVIIFSPNSNGEVTGHWYGYVTPDDVPMLLEEHIGKGRIIDRLWRGQMGLSKEDQKYAQSIRLKKESGISVIENTFKNGVTGGCCQGTGNDSCCQNISSRGAEKAMEKRTPTTNCHSERSKISRARDWFKGWELEDTFAALSVISAAAFVAVAYGCYKHLK